MAPGIGQVSPLAADLANEGGYARAYGSFLQRPTRDFTQGAFGPFSPVLPVPINQPPEGGERPEPRRFQYPVGWNLPVGEPGLEGLKLASFGTLRTLADLYSVARACIELRKNEVRGLAWDIIPTAEAAKTYQGSPSQMKDFGKRRAEAIKFFNHPDPNYFSWNRWVDALLEEIFVYDALSLLLRPKWGKNKGKGLLGSDLDSLELISGATIRPLLDINGGVPRPPAPAYQQYLYGVPRSDMMTMITQRDVDESGLRGSELNQFRGDQLLYLPMVPRTWTPYGFPPIERAMIPVRSGLNKQVYQLNYFTEGTVPSVFISPGDANMTPNQIRELQDALNAIAGDPAWKHKIIVLPPGSHIDPMHGAQLADQFDEIVMSQVCMAFDISPMELGVSPKVSTTQSPGAANQMAKMAQNTKDRVATRPLLNFLSDIFEAILHRVAGQDDMQFTFEGLQEEEDQETLTNMLTSQINIGLRSIDEGREELNLQPWGMPETSEPIMVTPTGPVPLASAVQAAAAQHQASAAGSAAATQAFQSGKASPQQVVPSQQQQTQAQAQQHSQSIAEQNLRMRQESHDVNMQSPAAPTPGHQAAAAGSGTTSAAASPGNVAARTAGVSNTPGAKNKAMMSELQALARHLKKGRYIGSWEAVNIPAPMLSSIAGDLAKGVMPDQAVTKALLVTPDSSLEKWEFNPAEARDAHGRWTHSGESELRSNLHSAGERVVAHPGETAKPADHGGSVAELPHRLAPQDPERWAAHRAGERFREHTHEFTEVRRHEQTLEQAQQHTEHEIEELKRQLNEMHEAMERKEHGEERLKLAIKIGAAIAGAIAIALATGGSILSLAALAPLIGDKLADISGELGEHFASRAHARLHPELAVPAKLPVKETTHA